MSPSLGRALWGMLHDFAASYPDVGTRETRELATGFLIGFRERLMRAESAECGCRIAMHNAMKLYPPPLSGRVEFVRWTEALHELVNLKLGKPRFKPALRHPLLTRRVWQQLWPALSVPGDLPP